MSTLDQKTQEISLENPKGKSFELSDILTDRLLDSYLAIPPAWHELDESKLVQLVKPTEMDWKLRYKFSAIYADFCNPKHHRYRKLKISGSMIFTEICSRVHWYDRVATDPKKVAFITRPFVDDIRAAKIHRALANNRLIELLTIDMYDDTGKLDIRKANLVLSTIKEVRNQGGLIFNINNNSQVQQNNLQAQAATPGELAPSMDDIDKRIQELEHELNKRRSALPKPKTKPLVLDVGSEDGSDHSGTEGRIRPTSGAEVIPS